MSLPRPIRPPRVPAVDRFLRYVRIETTSQDGQATIPSTPGQWDLARLLVDELKDLDVEDVRLSGSCIVYATIPSNIPSGTARSQPETVGFVSHVDTSPALSGAHVTPIVHANYQGGDLVLPADPAQVIPAEDLVDLRGDDIITADGRTLLGSDDKSGVAAIMTMVDMLRENPWIAHGRIAIAFTPDEEVGRGVDTFDVEGFGAAFAYTVDGDALGEINHETWNAKSATVTFRGVSAHPGTAKGVMVNAAYALAELIAGIPVDMRPETTEGRIGFLHPYVGTIDIETSTLTVLLRDFDPQGINAKEALLRDLADDITGRLPGVRIDIDVVEQYRNMNEVLKDHPRLVAWAIEAARRAGLDPHTRPIRGGTDGARLTFRGLPCPNIFTGGRNFHSKIEFNSRRGLEQTTETLVHLVQLIASDAAGR